MATGMIGLCGQCVINLVIVEKDQELDYVTTPLRNLVETTAMASPWRQVYVMNHQIQENSDQRKVRTWTLFAQ